MNDKDAGKKAAARYAAGLIEDDMLVGLGTGTTTSYFIEFLSIRCREGLKIKAAATSQKSGMLAEKGRIPLININTVRILDIDVDGADEVDPEKRMIKGGGGALLREKIVATMSKEMVVIIDQSKEVKELGAFPIPIEIVPYAYPAIISHINNLGYKGRLREEGKDKPYVTDNGNLIYDIQLEQTTKNPEIIERDLCKVPGVIEIGLFLGIAGRIIVGLKDGNVRVRK